MTKSKRFVSCVSLVLTLGLVAQAQTTKKPAREATAESAPDKQTGEPERAAEPPDPTSGDDLGPAPPPSSEQREEKTPPSPLTPEPNEFPKGELKPPPAEYDQLLSEIAALRSRVAALTTTL